MIEIIEKIKCDYCREIINKTTESRIAFNISGTGKLTLFNNTCNIKGKMDFCNIECLSNYCKHGIKSK